MKEAKGEHEGGAGEGTLMKDLFTCTKAHYEGYLGGPVSVGLSSC